MTDLSTWLNTHDTANGDLWTALQGQGYVATDSFAVMAHADRNRLRPNLEAQNGVTPALVDRLYLAIDNATRMYSIKNTTKIPNSGFSVLFVPFSLCSLVLLDWCYS